jgi:hypothetical protein
MRLRAFALLAAVLWAGAAHAQAPTQAGLGAPARAPVSKPGPAQPPSAPMVSTAAPGPLRSFDPRKTELKHVENRWVILADGAVLREFGPREADAREALAVIRALKLNQHGTVGSPPVMEYWLSDGHAPFAPDKGLRLLPLDLNTLQVDQGDGQWRVRDRRRLLFAFPRREDAYLALDLIRHYGFTQIGHVGQFVPAMVYFVGSPSDQGRPPSLPPPGTPDPWRPGQRSAAKPSGVVKAGAAAPAAPAGALTEHWRFDFRGVQVRCDKGEWKLTCGSRVLASFGPNQLEARQAWNAVQYYRFSEQCRIGRPTPSFSYFLVAGQAPRGLRSGLATQPFRPEAVLVRPLGQGWAVTAGEEVLAQFERVEEARELAEAIQRYHFDHLCHVGTNPGPGMTFLVKSHGP